VQAFFCQYTLRWYPVDRYKANPDLEQYCAPEYIVEKKGNGDSR